MSNAESSRFYDLFRKVASLEKRLNWLENSHQLPDTVAIAKLPPKYVNQLQ